MNPASFHAICPVEPIRFSERTIRFDRVALDNWIDGLSRETKSEKTIDWLAAMGQPDVPTKRRK